MNKAALKRIRKLSDWFTKHRMFKAENMRHRLAMLIVDRHGNMPRPSARAELSEDLTCQELHAKSYGGTTAKGKAALQQTGLPDGGACGKADDAPSRPAQKRKS